MTGSLRTGAILVLLGFSSAALAETVYVAERIRIGLRADLLETSAVVKTIETGVALEVVERFEKQTKVRDPQGTEGWIETRFLSPDPPARLQLAKLQEDLTRSRTQASEAQAQLKKAQATVAEQTDRIRQLEKSLSDKPSPAPAPAAPSAAKKPPVNEAATNNGFSFSYLWLGISFAMLGIGFAAGIKWLRESIRKRSGGMYLRV